MAGDRHDYGATEVTTLRKRIEKYLTQSTVTTAAVLGTTPERQRKGTRNDVAYEMVRRTLLATHYEMKAMLESLDLESKPKGGWPEENIEESAE